MAFIDGDDLCRDCGRCCQNVTALRVTDDDLARLPLLSTFVTRTEGPFRLLDIPGRCPYLGSDLRCTVFAERPFDCSLYPVNVATVTTLGVRSPDGVVEARWMFGGGDECPHREEFVGIARRQDLAPVRDWIGQATGARVVVLRTARGERARAAAIVWLHRAHLLDPARRLVRAARRESQRLRGRRR